jgi:hypothetical protein
MNRFIMVVITAFALAVPAHAMSYSNYASWDKGSGICCFGAPDTTAFGETFTAPASELNSFTFYANAGGESGSAKLVIANWDGTRATGTALYTSDSVSLTGSNYQAYGVSGMHVSLTEGSQYVAYLTVADVVDPISNNAVVFAGVNNDDGGLGGKFVFVNSNGLDPLQYPGNWTTDWSWPKDVAFTASFSSVPLPAALPLFGMAISALGMTKLRRRKSEV